MNKLTKIAFVDVDTGEFYRDTKEDAHRFTGDITRSMLYHERKEIRQYFNIIANASGRNLKCVEVKVEFTVRGDSDYFDRLKKEDENRELIRYKNLCSKANKDVDSMTKREFRNWRFLKKKFEKKRWYNKIRLSSRWIMTSTSMIRYVT